MKKLSYEQITVSMRRSAELCSDVAREAFDSLNFSLGFSQEGQAVALFFAWRSLLYHNHISIPVDDYRDFHDLVYVHQPSKPAISEDFLSQFCGFAQKKELKEAA